MPPILICRTATTFTAGGQLDEEALRAHLERLACNGHGVYLASGGSGEGHALRLDELRRVYEIGVETCRGRVPVFANPPEQHTHEQVYEHSMTAHEAGVEMVNVYGPTNLHGYVPTDDEYVFHHERLLERYPHPVALAPNPIIGYTPSPHLVAALCNAHPQVKAINLALLSADFMREIETRLTRSVHFYVPVFPSFVRPPEGVHGLLGAEANVIPETYRRYIDLLAAGEEDELKLVHDRITRFSRYVSAWGTSPRWIKMAMRLLELPGAAGGTRPPYLLPSEAEVRRFGEGLRALAIPELSR